MAVTLNKISLFQFMSLDGQLIRPSTQLDVNQRPGVDGTEFLNIKKRGQKFTLRSTVDCASFEDAQYYYRLYSETAISTPALPVVQSNFDTSQDGYFCKVLDVRIVDIHRSLVIMGGLQYTSGAILICDWDLLSVDLGVI